MKIICPECRKTGKELRFSTIKELNKHALSCHKTIYTTNPVIFKQLHGHSYPDNSKAP